MGETGSVSYNFEQVGEIKYELKNVSKAEFFDYSIEKNANDVYEDDNYIISNCDLEIFGSFRDKLENKFGEPIKSKLIWKAKNLIEVDAEIENTILTTLELLEENDDVQDVYCNMNKMNVP